MAARFTYAGLALAAAALAGAMPAAAQRTRQPPQVGAVSVPVATELLTWQVEAMGCADGTALEAEVLTLPFPVTNRIYLPPERMPVTLQFDLDAEGRPLSIRREAGARANIYEQLDLMPALRASRFAVEGAATGCSLTFTSQAAPLAEVALEALARFGVAQRARIEAAAWDRFAPGDCRERPRPAPRLRAYPDWSKLDRSAGLWGWTYIRYDIDAEGVPTALETVISSGDAALDAEGLAAVAASRFAEGPRTGCAQAWWRGPGTVPAPPAPPLADFEPNPACEIEDRWATEPRLTYPPAYRKRAIEGWAVLRFDVAPWGEIGEIEVLDAQPSSEFGDAAVNVLKRARLKPQEGGLSGCVDRVFFRMRKSGDTPAEGDMPPDS